MLLSKLEVSYGFACYDVPLPMRCSSSGSDGDDKGIQQGIRSGEALRDVTYNFVNFRTQSKDKSPIMSASNAR